MGKALVDDVLGGASGSSLQVRCMYSASWTCPDLVAYHPEYVPCWDAARLAQSDEGLPHDVTPCNNSRGWFTLGDPRVQPVDLVDRTHRWATYFAEIRSALGADGDAAVSTFDYVTSPLDDVSTPATNEAMRSVPAVRVRPPATTAPALGRSVSLLRPRRVGRRARRRRSGTQASVSARMCDSDWP